MCSIRNRRSTAQSFAVFCLLWLSASTYAADSANFAGIWQISAPQTSFKPIGGSLPFTPLGKEVYNENEHNQRKRDYDKYDSMQARCSAPGVPRVMLTPQRFQILQHADLVMMAFQWNRVRRTITLPGLPTQDERIFGPSAKLVGTMMGTSKGHWEGDTLVVSTDEFSEGTLIDDLVPHGYDLKVTERIRLKDADTLEDRITIEDPEYFVRPWETVVTYRRQPMAVIPEDVCLDRLLGPPPLPTR